MRRRVIGGIAGWIIGALPLVGVNVVAFLGFYFDNPILIGAVALLAGLVLGGIVSGLIGANSYPGGAFGAILSGSISAVLYALTILSLILIAPSLGVPALVTADQLFHIVIAVLFCAALLLVIAMLTGWLAGRGQSDPETLPMPILPQRSYRQHQVSKPPAPNRMYNNLEASSRPAELMQRGEGRSQPAGSRSGGYPDSNRLLDQGENFDNRRYQPAQPGRPSGPHHSDRYPHSREARE